MVDFFGDSGKSKLRWRLFLATLAAIMIADFLVTRDHGEFFWDFLPGWGAGLVGTVFLKCTEEGP